MVGSKADEYAGFNSTGYWRRRYRAGGKSGAGSYGRLADYKASYVNEVTKDRGIKSIVEFGCGDGNQASMFEITNYTGLDVSQVAVRGCRAKFADRAGWSFEVVGRNPVQKCDMESLFAAASRFVLIYASDKDAATDKRHVRHRNYSRWIAKNMPNWALVDEPEHPFPLDKDRSKKTHSFANFKLFERKSQPQMIRAHMATFPVRADILPAAIDDICKQVDQLFLVLNEYDHIPDYIAANPKIEAVIPEEDFKDVGKFVFAPEPDDIVFFVDDDVQYPDDFVVKSLRTVRSVGLEHHVFGYHCSIYEDGLTHGANSRNIFRLKNPNGALTYVDQIATNAMIALGKNVPPLSYMRGSQKFVDVRYAKWLFEHGVNSVVLTRDRRYIVGRPSSNLNDNSIWATFTKNSPDHVIEEIKSFAGRSNLVGKKVDEA